METHNEHAAKLARPKEKPQQTQPELAKPKEKQQHTQHKLAKPTEKQGSETTSSRTCGITTTAKQKLAKLMENNNKPSEN